MVDGFPLVDFNEGSRGASNIFEIKIGVLKLDFGVVSANALIKYEYLIGAVSSNFGSFLFD